MPRNKKLLLFSTLFTFGLALTSERAQATLLEVEIAGTASGLGGTTTGGVVNFTDTPFTITATFDNAAGTNENYVSGVEIITAFGSVNYYGPTYTLATFSEISSTVNVNYPNALTGGTVRGGIVLSDPSSGDGSYSIGIGSADFLVVEGELPNENFLDLNTTTVSVPFTQLDPVPTVFIEPSISAGLLTINGTTLTIDTITSASITTVPEPGSLTMLLSALAGLAACCWVRQSTRA